MDTELQRRHNEALGLITSLEAHSEKLALELAEERGKVLALKAQLATANARRDDWESAHQAMKERGDRSIEREARLTERLREIGEGLVEIMLSSDPNEGPNKVQDWLDMYSPTLIDGIEPAPEEDEHG